MIQPKTSPDRAAPLSREEVGSLASIIMVMQRRFMASLMGELTREKSPFRNFSYWGTSVPKGRRA